MVKKRITQSTQSTQSQTDFWEDAKSYIDIRNCKFGFECHQKWGDLLKRKEPHIRFCNECDKEVYLIQNNDELAYAIKFNHCVAIKVRHDEIPEPKRPNITVGMLTAPDYDEPAFMRNKK